ncbi:MAG: zf-TFIIB domain-containing protein [candidate division Zixibacteria bacterium]|nr:zf-TFIIB domain-containing protein [candidate division Zixibacteria bacterium]
MKCPACGNSMVEMNVGSITVDVCRGGCGGIWFDRFELQKVDEPHESAGESLLDIERNSNVKIDPSRKRKCPKCKDIIMMRHFFSVKKEVEVDECPNCAGFWIDYGELAFIRRQYNTEEERKKAADDYFSEIFGRELGRMRKEGEEGLEKAKKIAHMFRFICPSNYIPGKQDWGAF